MLSLDPRYPDGSLIQDPWRVIAEKGPGGVGHILDNPPRDFVGNPANRMVRPPGVETGVLANWIRRTLSNVEEYVLLSHGLDSRSIARLSGGDMVGFVKARERLLISLERQFQETVGVIASSEAVGNAPIDTD
jgi:hypothetical protein